MRSRWRRAAAASFITPAPAGSFTAEGELAGGGHRCRRPAAYLPCSYCVLSEVTTRVARAVLVRLPLTPLIVSAKVPAGVLVLVVTVSVDEVPDAGLGEKLAAAPAGRPVKLRVTAPAKPPVWVIVTVYVVLVPAVTVWEV